MTDFYEKALEACGCLREEPASLSRLKEWEIQARFYAGELGVTWACEDGRLVEVLDFGVWNREAGPDFKSVRIRFEDGEIVSGDIELDRDVRDWERHGHSVNPTFDSVVLHVFLKRGQKRFFTKNLRNTDIPQVCLEKVERQIPRTLVTYGTAIFQNEENAARFIEAAAKFRIRRKREIFLRAVKLHGEDQAFFQLIASGMGYKNNAIPFQLVAQRLGLRAAGGEGGEAQLFGLAGFLQAKTFDQAPRDTRDYLRDLWESWWTVRDRNARLILPAQAWRLAGIRPANHPHRRMGALAVAARQFPALLKAAGLNGSDGFCSFWNNLRHPYWDRHWNLSSSHLGKETALVGRDRILDLLINAYVPSLPEAKAWTVISELKGPPPNSRVCFASQWLMGKADRRRLQSAVVQQGLLQILTDFSETGAEKALQKFFSV